VSSSYVYDAAWSQERARLQGIEGLFDEITRARLLAAGIQPGWWCLEVGCGAGSIASWMAVTVGVAGHVLATDLDPRFVQDGPSLEVRRHDILADPLPQATFDLVHSRMVLEHVAERDRALARMVEALKPGGVIVLEDVYFGGPMAAALASFVRDESLVEVWERCLRAFEQFMGAAGADVSFGARLGNALEAAGLEDVYADMHAHAVRGGSNDFGILSLAQLREPMIAAGLLTPDECDRLMELLNDPAQVTMSIPLVGARGRRPAPAA
jgi:SAM-dependent methyltransferase